MKRERVFLSVAVAVFFACYGSVGHALEVKTHERINEHVAKTSAVDSYLKTRLGIVGGVEEKLGERRVWEWIRDGGRFEDVPAWYLPYLRSFNHFHDPLTNAGFKGLWRSSIAWGLLPPSTQSPGGYYSWSDVRGYFFGALTAQGDAAREQGFAETFRGVGQLMHLIQDAAQPAHVRNDPHPLDDMGVVPQFENWARTNSGTVLGMMTSPIFPSVPIDKSIGGYVPITQFWDTDQYGGANPTGGTSLP